jgi:pentatricopeptide repeat protein
MIVKNEEKFLPRCLESVQGLVDEIIIIDTGSEDNTKTIGAQYTNHIYDFEWCNDFSAARNESLRYATGKWILVLDADEYVQNTGHGKLRKFLEGYNHKKPYGFIVKILNFMGSGYDETNMMESTGARLFSNKSGIQYTLPIHEQLTSSQGSITFPSLSFTIFHSGYIKEIVQLKNKSKRNMSILETMKSDSHNESYYHFIVGNEYSNSGEMEQALQSYQLSYKKSYTTDSWYHHLLDRLITLEMQLDQHHLAYNHILTGININPDHTDYYCLKGILLDSLGCWNDAAREFEKCIQIAEDADNKNIPYWIVQPAHGKIIPYQMLADIHRKKGDLSSAIKYWIKTLQLQPKNYKVLRQLAEHLLCVQNDEQTEDILETLYPLNVPMNAMLLLKIVLQTGNQRLVERYRQLVNGLGIQLGYEDTIMSGLLSKETIGSTSRNEETLPSPFALMAAVVYGNISFADGAASDKEACSLLARQALLVLHDHTWDQEALEGHEELLAQALLFMWKYGYNDLYFTLLQRMANARTLNLLADLLCQTGRMDEALELFSLLLDNKALAAEGIKTVGQWYINMGELSDGYPFINTTLDTKPSLDLLGKIQPYLPSEEGTDMLNKYYSYYPHMENILV